MPRPPKKKKLLESGWGRHGGERIEEGRGYAQERDPLHILYERVHLYQRNEPCILKALKKTTHKAPLSKTILKHRKSNVT